MGPLLPMIEVSLTRLLLQRRFQALEGFNLVLPPLLFEQQLDDHPLVRQVHARPVRRVDRNRL
jgi:hypothetical protein